MAPPSSLAKKTTSRTSDAAGGSQHGSSDLVGTTGLSGSGSDSQLSGSSLLSSTGSIMKVLKECDIKLPILSGRNEGTPFREWITKLHIGLAACGLDSLLSYPSPDSARSAIPNFEALDAQFHALITLHVTGEAFTVIEGTESGCEAWWKLNKEFDRSDGATRFELLRKFINFRSTGSMSSHFLEMSSMANQLRSKGAVLSNEMEVHIILNSLPRAYDTLVTTLSSVADGELTRDFVKSRVLTQEARFVSGLEVNLYAGKENVGGVGGNAKRSKRVKRKPVPDDVCHKCGVKGHWAKDCKNKVAPKEVAMVIDENPDPKVWPSKKQKLEDEDQMVVDQVDQLMPVFEEVLQVPIAAGEEDDKQAQVGNALVEEAVLATPGNAISLNENQLTDSYIFVIDSGASSHSVSSLELVSTFVECETFVGQAEASRNLKAIGRGEVIGLVNHRNSDLRIVLKDVLVVPSMRVLIGL